MNLRNIFKTPKLISTQVIVENNKSYEVRTYQNIDIGEITEQKIEVNKSYYQPQIDKLQEQLDTLQSRKDACYE